MSTRTERDSMGEFQVPQDALYGAQTARAVDNFPISGQGIGRPMIRALGLVKLAAAQVNEELGLLEPRLAQAIVSAAEEVAEGLLDRHFPVDLFQTGSGTSSNMNANEVIANRAIQQLGGEVGSKSPVHPNDHVNFGQSSNDVFPTAIHVAAMTELHATLLPALHGLEQALDDKAQAYDDVVKIGRTHLQDATPVRLGQELSGYAAQVRHAAKHLERCGWHMHQLPIGGTAVGTGINTHPEFGARMAARLAELTGVPFVEADNHFEAQAARDAVVQLSGTLKTLAGALIKQANDIRFLASGPRLGLGELELPAVQPGSSIMPGKVNPVMAEALIMASAQVIANDTAITLGGLYGNFELNVMMPLLARNLLEQITLLGRAVHAFTEKLVRGIKARQEAIAARNEQSLALATALAPHIGYDRAAELAKDSWRTGKTVRELARERQVMAEDELERALDLMRQTEPGL